jgi:hypothetical protein
MSLNALDLLAQWQYDDFFGLPTERPESAAIDRVEHYVVSRKLEEHPFFDLAAEDLIALHLWLSQELVMTNAFAQAVLYATSRIRNVHIRSCLSAVAYGEHGRVRRGRAMKSHPTLLDELRRTAQLDPSAVAPLSPTVELVGFLCSSLDDPLTALAVIGIGNERLIFPEYEAIWKCFESLLPKSSFAPFLKANLSEDAAHTDLCREAASQLIASEEDARKYEDAAIASVDARYRYFDGLLDHLANSGQA